MRGHGDPNRAFGPVTVTIIPSCALRPGSVTQTPSLGNLAAAFTGFEPREASWPSAPCSNHAELKDALGNIVGLWHIASEARWPVSTHLDRR